MIYDRGQKEKRETKRGKLQYVDRQGKKEEEKEKGEKGKKEKKRKYKIQNNK